MEQNLNPELKQISQELRNIVNDIERISHCIHKSFRGIGSEYCAESLEKVAWKYRNMANELEKMELTMSGNVAAHG